MRNPGTAWSQAPFGMLCICDAVLLWQREKAWDGEYSLTGKVVRKTSVEWANSGPIFTAMSENGSQFHIGLLLDLAAKWLIVITVFATLTSPNDCNYCFCDNYICIHFLHRYIVFHHYSPDWSCYDEKHGQSSPQLPSGLHLPLIIFSLI